MIDRSTVFYVSCHEADHDWGRWVTYQIEEAGGTVTLPGAGVRADPVLRAACERRAGACLSVLCLLSPDYLAEGPHRGEWLAVLGHDPEGRHDSLVQVRVRPCEPGVAWRWLLQVDLCGKPERRARQDLLARLFGIWASDPSLELPALPDRLRRVRTRPPFPGLPRLRSVPASAPVPAPPDAHGPTDPEPLDDDAGPLPNRRLLQALAGRPIRGGSAEAPPPSPGRAGRASPFLPSE